MKQTNDEKHYLESYTQTEIMLELDFSQHATIDVFTKMLFLNAEAVNKAKSGHYLLINSNCSLYLPFIKINLIRIIKRDRFFQFPTMTYRIKYHAAQHYDRGSHFVEIGHLLRAPGVYCI